jgi:hypothetical protein
MKTIPIRCTGCQVQWRAPLGESPRFVACPHCGNVLAVPADPQAEPMSASTSVKEPLAALPAVIAAGLLIATVAILYSTFARHAVPTPSPTIELATTQPVATIPRTNTDERQVNVPKVTFTRVARTPPIPNETEHASNVPSIASSSSIQPEPIQTEAVSHEATDDTDDTLEAETVATEPELNTAVAPTAVLERRVGRNFNQTRIQEVADFLTDSTGVVFTLDMRSLWYDQGTTRNVPVTLKAEDMTVREFLDAVVVKQLKATYVMREDSIVIMSRKAAKQATPDRTP